MFISMLRITAVMRSTIRILILFGIFFQVFHSVFTFFYVKLREGTLDSRTEQKGTTPIEKVCQEIVAKKADDEDEGYDSGTIL